MECSRSVFVRVLVLAISMFQSSETLSREGASQLNVANWGKPFVGHKLDVAALNVIKTKSILKCMSECTITERCVSINFGAKDEVGEHECELLHNDRHVMFSNFSLNVGWIYFGPKTKCDTNPCSESPCLPDYANNRHICFGKGDKDCKSLLKRGLATSGLYFIYEPNMGFAQVYCDQTTDGGGWLTIQRNDQRNAPNDFLRTWQEYRNGFGELTSPAFWWGNEKVHKLTAARKFELRVDLIRDTGLVGGGKYEEFKLSSEQESYSLHYNAASFTGDIGDSFSYSTFTGDMFGKKFSTSDVDNDLCSDCNCATIRKAGWWYGHCSRADLNALIMEWRTWSGPMVYSEMKIRPL